MTETNQYNRCAWCGRFVSATTEPLTFPNAYGKPVIRILCPDDYPVAIGLGQRNLANLAQRQTQRKVEDLNPWSHD